MIKPSNVADYRCHTGENPLWQPIEEYLYWADIPNGILPFENADTIET